MRSVTVLINVGLGPGTDSKYIEFYWFKEYIVPFEYSSVYNKRQLKLS